MFDLPDHWVWDFWVADDGDLFHLFFLKAPRTLGDPDQRHWHASVGHAVSSDLTTWTRVADALDPQPEPAFDSLATWTGCCVRDEAGTWRMFSTGLTTEHRSRWQRVGVSTSTDLTTWRRTPDALVDADERWYATLAGGADEEHWRDPWVVRGADGRWHMYVTAQAREVPASGGRGVVGHAVSTDLLTWRVCEPLSRGESPFSWMEVVSVQEVEGRWVLVFSCLAEQMPGAPDGSGGVWSLAVPGPGEPFDVGGAVRLTDESRYVGKLVADRSGNWQLLAFVNQDHRGDFVGGVTDPLPVRWRADGRGLELVSDGVARGGLT
jgi:beta-fructofuranosidase